MAPCLFRKGMLKYICKTASLVVLIAFITTSLRIPVYAQVDPMPFMPKPGVMVNLSPEYTPAYLKGIVIHPENALKFDFIIYRGDKLLNDAQKREEYTKLTKYFLASLAIPDEDQWVNLSPYEKDRIIKDNFGKTEMGRDLLAQDYMLKQITASVIYPEDNLGKRFWDRVYSQAQKQYGTTNIPVNTFNKVWILPDDALIYEKIDENKSRSTEQETGNITAYVIKNHLRVMLEEDYLSLQKHSGIQNAPDNKTHSIASKIIKEIVIPELQREVNEGKNFAPLRQIYSGMILAAWFKRTLKQSLLGQIYANKAKVKGVDQNPKTNEEIYRQYLKAYKKGVFNLIKEDVDKYSNETIPRKYFSGGAVDNYPDLLSHGGITKVLDSVQDAAMKVEIADKEDLATVAMNAEMGKITRRAAVFSGLASLFVRPSKAFANEEPEVVYDSFSLYLKLFINGNVRYSPNYSGEQVRKMLGFPEDGFDKKYDQLTKMLRDEVAQAGGQVTRDDLLKMIARDGQKISNQKRNPQPVIDQLALNEFGEYVRNLAQGNVGGKIYVFDNTITGKQAAQQLGYRSSGFAVLYDQLVLKDREKILTTGQVAIDDVLDFAKEILGDHGVKDLTPKEHEKKVPPRNRFLKTKLNGPTDRQLMISDAAMTHGSINDMLFPWDGLVERKKIKRFDWQDLSFEPGTVTRGDFSFEGGGQVFDWLKGQKSLVERVVSNDEIRVGPIPSSFSLTLNGNFPAQSVRTLQVLQGSQGSNRMPEYIQQIEILKTGYMAVATGRNYLEGRVMGGLVGPNHLFEPFKDERGEIIKDPMRIAQDEEGNIYIMTFDSILRKYDMHGELKTTINFRENDSFNFVGNDFIVQDGKIYSAYARQLEVYDLTTKQLRHFSLDDAYSKFKSIQIGISVRMIFEMEKKKITLILDANSEGLALPFDLRTESFGPAVVFTKQGPVILRMQLFMVVKSEAGDYFVYDGKSIHVLNLVQKHYKGFILPPGDEEVRSMTLDQEGNLILGRQEGYYLIPQEIIPSIITPSESPFDIKDAAMEVQDNITTKGGIDMNSANLAMVIKRDRKGVPLPLVQQDLAQLSNIEGLQPVILSIKSASEASLFSQLQATP